MNQVDSLVDNVKKGTIIPSMIMILLGLFMIAITHVIVKYLDDYHGGFLTMARNVSGIVLLLFFLIIKHDFSPENRHLWKIPHLHWILTRSLFVVGAQMGLFIALQHMELGTARALNYSSAIFVTIFAMILFKEKCGIWRGSALVIGFLGMFMIVNQGAAGELENIFYYFVAIFSGFAFAGTLVILKFFSKENDHFVLMSYDQIATTILSIIVVLVFFEWQPITSVEDAILIFLIGLLGTGGLLFMAYAYRMVEASLLAPFQYFGLLFSLVLGWLFFAENPWDKLFPGALLIVGAGLVMAVHEHNEKVREAQRALKKGKKDADTDTAMAKEIAVTDIVKKIIATDIVKKIIATDIVKKIIATAQKIMNANIVKKIIATAQKNIANLKKSTPTAKKSPAPAKKSVATVTAKKSTAVAKKAPAQKTATAKKSAGTATAKKKSASKAKPKNVKK